MTWSGQTRDLVSVQTTAMAQRWDRRLIAGDPVVPPTSSHITGAVPATLPDVWGRTGWPCVSILWLPYLTSGVSVRTGWPGVSILWLPYLTSGVLRRGWLARCQYTVATLPDVWGTEEGLVGPVSVYCGYPT